MAKKDSESLNIKIKTSEEDEAEFVAQVPKAGPWVIWYALIGGVMWTLTWKLALVLGWTVLITSIRLYENLPLHDFFQIKKSTAMVPVFGTITGLLVAFRVHSAYDRYYEGRRVWTNMTVHSKNFARYILLLIPEKTPEDFLAKRAAVNLVIAFNYAVKNYLRGQFDYKGISRLIGHIPAFNKVYVQPEHFKTKHVAKCIDGVTPTRIPTDIAYHLTAFVNEFTVAEKIGPIGGGGFHFWICGLVECFNTLERIKNTPIPLSYAVHLHISVWIYLLSLPSQLADFYIWWTVPAVLIAAFIFLGLLDIAWEIENPFGKDRNDLPLGRLCKILEKEIMSCSRKAVPTVEEMYQSSFFHPDPSSPLSADNFLSMDLSALQTHFMGRPTKQPKAPEKTETAEPTEANESTNDNDTDSTKI